MFTDYLFNRKAIVQYGQEQSETLRLLSGVPQSSILGPLLFLIVINDLTDIIENSKVMKYADDTVLCIFGKDSNNINETLNSDLSRLDKWFAENELIMNLSKGKTEALLFSTSKKVAKESADFEVNVNDREIRRTTSCKYLGVQIGSTLSMSTYFDKCYKNASFRLNLQAKLREQLDVKEAKAIYECTILPTFTYCGILLLHNARTQSGKLDSFHNRAEAIINREREAKISLQSVTNANKQRACQSMP